MSKQQIDSPEWQQYKKQAAEFSQKVNPKPSEEEREQLKQEYLARRKQLSKPICEG